MKSQQTEKKLRKECFVSVGATAPFEQLIQAALSPPVLAKLREHGFTTINFQCGDSLHVFNDVKPRNYLGTTIKAFDFKREGLKDDIKACKKVEGESEEGLAITHAGKPHSLLFTLYTSLFRFVVFTVTNQVI